MEEHGSERFYENSFFHILEKFGTGHICCALFKKLILSQGSFSKIENIREVAFTLIEQVKNL
jgi:hypothetical protein